MNEELKSQVEELSNKVKELTEKLNETSKKLDEYTIKHKEHIHNGEDGTNTITGDLRLHKDRTIKLADCEIAQLVRGINTSGETNMFAIAVGRDPRSGIASNSENAQFNIVHQPQSTISYISGIRPPLYINSTVISTTSGGSTITFTGANFVVNDLAGASVNIYDSTGALVEMQTIASNTATVITISSTWLNTTTGGTAEVLFPMYLGISNYPWQRGYVMDGSGGGIRFGGGATNNGQNALLYTDGTSLKFRKKDGTVTTVTVV